LGTVWQVSFSSEGRYIGFIILDATDECVQGDRLLSSFIRRASLQGPHEAISGPTELSLLNPYDIAVDELSLYGQCTNPIYCDETNIKRGDNCPK
jgi:hypothetical protein